MLMFSSTAHGLCFYVNMADSHSAQSRDIILFCDFGCKKTNRTLHYLFHAASLYLKPSSHKFPFDKQNITSTVYLFYQLHKSN